MESEGNEMSQFKPVVRHGFIYKILGELKNDPQYLANNKFIDGIVKTENQ